MTRLGPIACVTMAVSEMQRAVDVYRLYLGYELVDSGRLTASDALLWGKPALNGRRFSLLLPAGQGQTYIRFIESKLDPSYVAFRHFGWNAAELMVQDTDAVAAKLADSPFKIIGPPADLSFSDKIRAMQVLGPSRESLYLTSFKERLPEFDTPEAKHFVDRTFIVIVGGTTVASINDYFATHFGTAPAPEFPGVISVISAAHGLPLDTKHPLAAITLTGQSFIEADGMPSGTMPRVHASADELPPAISMVSFGVDSFPDSIDTWLGPAQTLPQAPYYGRPARVCVGSAGEWIELIQR
jgi:catechol 2,3-dioxygenase-like lactoylglutathione lyase family enzyme